MRRIAWLMAVLMILALPLVGTAQAQAGRVSGVVTDSSGAVLPGATVTITGPGVARTAVTDSVGRFAVADLPAGSYEVAVELSGFTRKVSKLVVAPGETVSLETQLQIGAQAETVQVTGSLIPRPTLEAMSPVTTLDPEAITYRGMTRVEDLLMSLPQVFAAQNSTIANGASGTATVDLRYVGSRRTLVLIDGRRMPSGDAWETAPDLNFIPSALVKRVDILTGGASAVYGADAVAGVVNFVLDKDFEGIRGGIQFGAYQHNNNNDLAQTINKNKGFAYPTGSVWNQAPTDLNVALGGRFADRKGYAAAYIDYRTMDAIHKDQRDYTNCATAQTMSGPACSGSGTWQYGRFLVFSADGTRTRDLVVDATTGNTFRTRVAATDAYNYAPANFMQRPDDRWAGGGFLTYKWNDKIEGYAEVQFMDDYTDAQIAPSGDFGNTGLLNCDNPMLSAQQRQLLCTDMGYGPNDIAEVYIYRRNIEGGGRVAQIRHTSLRFSFGVKGDLNKAWSYDVYGLQAEVHSPQSYANDFNADRIQDALIVDGNPGDPSSWYCRSGNTGCAPWNIFTVGGVSQASLQYLQLPLILNSGVRTRVLSATIRGDLKDYGIAFPTAIEGIRIAGGVEYRNESLFVNPDLAYQLALGAGQGGPTMPVSGDYDVKEAYVEALVPVVQDAPGFKDLSLEFGYRYSDYSSTGSWPTFKVQGSWAPIDDVKVRLGFNRATRSPNIRELFAVQQLSLGGAEDICSGTNPVASQAQCAQMGVPAAWYGRVLENPAGQYNTWSGGNPDLTPEIADTITAGIVFQPRMLPGFTAALDYYNLKIDDTVGALGPEDIQNACAETGDPRLCGLIHRDRLYTLWALTDGYTITTNQNIGKYEVQGLDINATYSRAAGDIGSFTANVIGTRLMKQYINTGLFDYDCVGYFGNQCGVPTPKWRHMARLLFETRYNTSISFAWRMIGPVENDDLSPNDAIGAPSNIALLEANDVDKFSAQNYFDLGVTYKLTRHLNLTFGVNNIFDREPPLAAGMQDNDYGTGFYGTYDPLGRYIFTGIQFTF